MPTLHNSAVVILNYIVLTYKLKLVPLIDVLIGHLWDSQIADGGVHLSGR